MDKTYTPAEAFPPGDYLREELQERGWTVTEFAEILGRPVQAVSEILNAKKEITPDTALALSDALGTSAEVWLSLQNAYRLYQIRVKRGDGTMTPVQRRARLREVIPLAEVRRRGWIPDTDNMDQVDAAVCELLEIDSLDERPAFAAAARRANSGDPATPEQTAWLGRVRRVAERQPVGVFDVGALGELAPRLAGMLRDGPSGLADLPGRLAACGVRLVFCEGLRGGRLDGAVSFLGDGGPVIGLTARGNRFDSLLFTLLHECAHLTLGHITPERGALLDDDLTETTDDPIEAAANDQAGTWLIPDGCNVGAASSTAIDAAAEWLGVHPSVVIGRLQRDSQNWSLHRRRIPKVRPALEEAGLLS